MNDEKITLDSLVHKKMHFEDFILQNAEEHKILQEAIFGCPEKGEIGMKKKVDELYTIMTGGTWAWRFIVAVLILLGTIVGILTGIKKL